MNSENESYRANPFSQPSQQQLKKHSSSSALSRLQAEQDTSHAAPKAAASIVLVNAHGTPTEPAELLSQHAPHSSMMGLMQKPSSVVAFSFRDFALQMDESVADRSKKSAQGSLGTPGALGTQPGSSIEESAGRQRARKDTPDASLGAGVATSDRSDADNFASGLKVRRCWSCFAAVGCHDPDATCHYGIYVMCHWKL
jgi:hypothetical protein